MFSVMFFKDVAFVFECFAVLVSPTTYYETIVVANAVLFKLFLLYIHVVYNLIITVLLFLVG